MMLVSLTLSVARQRATSSTNAPASRALTVALSELNISNALPPRIHVVGSSGTDHAGLIASRHEPGIELYDLLRKRVHRNSQHCDYSASRSSKRSPMNMVQKIQSTPRPPACAVEGLEVYEATWTVFEVLPFELPQGLANYHEHGGFGQCR